MVSLRERKRNEPFPFDPISARRHASLSEELLERWGLEAASITSKRAEVQKSLGGDDPSNQAHHDSLDDLCSEERVRVAKVLLIVVFSFLESRLKSKSVLMIDIEFH